MARTVVRVTFAFVAFLLVVCVKALNSEAQNNQNIPPRIEIGGVLSGGTHPDIGDSGNYFHFGGGGRFTLNATRFLAVEAELTGQPTRDPSLSPELHALIAAKFTYRAEQARWLKIAGLNFFGIAGPAFLNRTVEVLSVGCPSLGCEPPLQRQTAATLEWGGGFEVVPAPALAVRFDVTHAAFSQPVLFSSQTLDQPRTYFKVAVMFRLPSLHRSAGHH